MENKIPDGDVQRRVVKIERLDASDSDDEAGELCIRLPDELMEQLGWEVGDEVEWEETEIGEDWGEHKGFILSNLTKNPNRDHDELMSNKITQNNTNEQDNDR
jgi:antitoxin component of MazEF toxin-antitoxin module